MADAIEVYSTIKNLSPLPDIGFQYQDSGLPWYSVAGAHNGTPAEYRAVGKSRFVDDGSGLKEYWYKEGVTLADLVPRYEHLETPQAFLEAIQNESAAAEESREGAEQIKDQMQEMLTEGTSYLGFWDPVDNIPNVSSIPAAGSYYIIGRSGIRNIGSGLILYEEGRKIISNGTTYDQSPPVKPGLNTVSVEMLIGWLQALFQQLPDDSPYIDAKLDSHNRKLWAIRKLDGFIEGRFVIEAISMMANSVHSAALQAGVIDYTKLAQAVKDLMYQTFDNTDSDWLKLLLDTSSRIISGEKKDGTVFISKPEFPNGKLKEIWMDPAFTAKIPSVGINRLITPNQYDVDAVDDQLWRGVEIEIPVKTSPNVGYAFTQLPFVKTPVLKGLNDTGVSLLFKETLNLPIRGRYYRGDFDPTASGVAGITLKGVYGNSYTNSYPAFPSGNTGDCWVIDCGNTVTTKTANSLTFKNGDMLVKTESGHAIQPGPGNGTYVTQQSQFWNISAAGFFGGIFYPANSRINLLGLQSQSGPKYIKYAKSKPGELYVMGECDAAFAPSSPRDGDLYFFSANATTQGITGIIGDSLTYRGGWGLLPSRSINVASGQSFFLQCQNAAEWSVRRVDKSATVVSIKAYGHKANARRKVTDSLRLLSDSMFGVSQLGTKILTLTGRAGVVESWGGATSEEVLATMRDSILTTDLYSGNVNVFWHGQNNGSDIAQTKIAAYQMAALTGSVEARFVFWSVLGVRTLTWNGTRFVAQTQEDAFAGTNYIADLEKFYETVFPKQYFSPRKAMLETAALRTTKPSIQYPGMTDAQVAATYGVLPLAYFIDFSNKPFTQDNLVYLGNHTAAGLPTGGADKQFYNRNGGGTVGSLIVNVAGTWTEYTPDYVHLSPEGADAVAAKFVTFLQTANI
jgi:hypothetical protein